MEYGIFLAVLGGAIIVTSIVVGFILLLNDMSPIKYKAQYLFALGCSAMILSYPIVNDPSNKVEEYYFSCITSYSYSTVTNTTREQICSDATVSYKKKVLGL